MGGVFMPSFSWTGLTAYEWTAFNFDCRTEST